MMDDNIVGKFDFSSIKVVETRSHQTAIYDKRSFWKRWFTLPWKPFQKMKIIGYTPWNEMLLVGRTLFVSPETAERLRKQIEEQNDSQERENGIIQTLGKEIS